VKVENGYPTPKQVFVFRNGTVQFVNHDPVDYKLRLYARDRSIHADVDLLLSGRCGVTVIVDEGIGGPGECYYELFPILVPFFNCFDEFAAQALDSVETPAIESSTDELGNVVEEVANASVSAAPGPAGGSPQLAFQMKKGPGGGIITVP
jgi:hypothetical protein